jgi:hypothetical protein
VVSPNSDPSAPAAVANASQSSRPSDSPSSLPTGELAQTHLTRFAAWKQHWRKVVESNGMMILSPPCVYSQLESGSDLALG